jgi:hypothetical protein
MILPDRRSFARVEVRRPSARDCQSECAIFNTKTQKSLPGTLRREDFCL